MPLLSKEAEDGLGQPSKAKLLNTSEESLLVLDPRRVCVLARVVNFGGIVDEYLVASLLIWKLCYFEADLANKIANVWK